MISVQGVGETVSVVKYNVLDTKGRVWEGDSPVRVIPSEGIEKLKFEAFVNSSVRAFFQKGLKCKIN